MRMPGQFVLTPKNRMLRVGGSRVSRTGREESRPLSGPRQIAVRIMYKTPQRTSSAPSPIRNIFASQFIAAPHNRTVINRGRPDSFRNRNNLQRFEFIYQAITQGASCTALGKGLIGYGKAC